MSHHDEKYDILPCLDRNLGRVLVPGDKINADLFVADFLATEFGQRLESEGLTHAANRKLIAETAIDQYGHLEINMQEFLSVARRLYLLGDLQAKRQPVAQAPAPKPLSSSQLAWQEYRIFTESNPVAACKARASRDEGYRKFLHTNLEREMNDTPVEDASVQPVHQSARITEDLRVFADTYRRTSVTEVKRLSSPTMNPVGHKEYVDSLNACIACGLV